MNLLIRSNYRAEIILSSAELDSYGITYEEIDYGNIQTRRLLWLLRQEVQKKYNYSIRLSGRVLIEVMKDTEGGIRICFSSLSSDSDDVSSLKQLIKSSSSPVIAEFSDIEEMLQAVSLLDGKLKSSLYEKNGKYRMLFSLPEEARQELIFCLCEFSEIFEDSPKKTAESRELWNILAEDNAVSCLHRLF